MDWGFPILRNTWDWKLKPIHKRGDGIHLEMDDHHVDPGQMPRCSNRCVPAGAPGVRAPKPKALIFWPWLPARPSEA